jgi:hypothetical protein
MARSRDPGFRVIVSLTDQFTRPINNLNNKIAQSTAKIRGLAAVPGAIFKATGLANIGGALGRVGGSVLQLRNAVTGLLGPFARLGVIAGGVGLGTFVYDAVNAGGELVKLQQTTGAGVEALQRLQYAAKQSGVDVGTMNGALVRLNRSIIEAMKPAKKKGVNEFAAAFRAAGISLADLRKLKPEEVFLRLSSAVANMSSQTNKAALAQKLLGKTGAELIPVMNEGVWGINALGNELASTGAIMSEATAKSAKAFGDTMLKLSQHVRGLAYDVLQELLPAMTGAAGGVDEWVQANREWIKTEVITIIRDLVGIGQAFVKLVQSDIIPAVQSLAPLWDGLVAVIGKNKAMLLAFTGVVAPGIIGAIIGIGKALVGLVAALAANPIGAAIIAIGAAAFLIYKYWEPISQFFVDLWDGVKNTFSAALGWLVDFGDNFARGALFDDWQPLIGQFADLWAGIKAVFWGALDWLGDFASAWLPQPILDAWAAVADFFAGLWERAWHPFPGGLERLGEFARAFTPVLFEAAWRGLAGLFEGLFPSPAAIIEAWGALGSFFEELWSGTEGAFNAGVNAIKAIVAALVPQPILDAWGVLNDFFGVLTDAVSTKFSNALSEIGALLAQFTPQPLQDAWAGLVGFWQELWDSVTGILERARGIIGGIIEWIIAQLASLKTAIAGVTGAIGSIGNIPGAIGGAIKSGWQRLTGGGEAATAGATAATGPAMLAAEGPKALATATQQQVSKSEVQVNFANVPEGTRVRETRSTGNTEVSLRTEYAGPRGALAGAY